MTVGERIKALRGAKKFTQSDLAKLVDLTYIQVGRYEKGKSNRTEQVEAQLSDRELLRQFQEVEKLEPDDKHLIKTFIDAFITKRQLQKLAQ